MSTTPEPDPRHLLDAAESAVAEHDRLTARRERALGAVQAERQALAQARERLADETADVERLEHLSPARIWAGLRGDRAERLDRERAEQQAAQYAAGVVEARLAAAERELAAVDAELAALGDVGARRAQALHAVEAWVRTHGGAAAADLDALAREAGAVAAERQEVAEAAAAARTALGSLTEAAGYLRSADGWATYDTFFGGGLVADMVKHDKLDKAAALMRRADLDLRRLATELGDLGQQGVGGIGIDGLTSIFDWMDNIFGDWAVKNRIADAAGRVQRALAAVGHVQQGLAAREEALRHRAADVEARRAALLRAA
ncbi:hypothetical protein [Puerhibacterium puerhi]|uniref:hypothetical protein n=1 Tax=Puerhibacterium puerhi TaxID=2692623 RepID=UPI001356F0A3|nr:hypothetical protein [Puerhibacterium puerhi]